MRCSLAWTLLVCLLCTCASAVTCALLQDVSAAAAHGMSQQKQQQQQQQPAIQRQSRRQLHAAVAAANPAAVQPAGLVDSLHGLINGIEATLPALDLLSIPSLPELKLAKVPGLLHALDPKHKLQLVLSAAANHVTGGDSSDDTPLPSGEPATSVSSAVGFAFNGGTAAAKSTSHAGGKSSSSGPSAAESDATAIADRSSLSLAVSRSDADNLTLHGLGVSKSSATSVADHSSLAVSDAAALAAGLGGDSSVSQTTASAAAKDHGASYVGGTAVSSAGPGSTSLTISTGTGAAEQEAAALTRADSISLGMFGSDAQGSATADSKAAKMGAASLQSLMESFAFDGSRSDAASVAQASALHAGVSLVQDKAVAIGLDGATSATNTGSQGSAQLLGISVIDSVVRTILGLGGGQHQKSCAEAVNQAYSDIGTGPAVSKDTFILHLTQRADQQCVSSFKALLGKQQEAVAGSTPGLRYSEAAINSGGNLGSAMPPPEVAAALQASLPSFENVRAGVLARTAPAMLQAEEAVRALGAEELHQLKSESPVQVVERLEQLTFGRHQ